MKRKTPLADVLLEIILVMLVILFMAIAIKLRLDLDKVTKESNNAPVSATQFTIPEKEYTERGKVIYVTDNLFTVALADGTEWECYAEGLRDGDMVEITFNNNRTYDVYDDSIVAINPIRQRKQLPKRTLQHTMQCAEVATAAKNFVKKC